MPEEPKGAALSFLKGNSTGVLATLSPDGAPRARTVYYAADDSFNVYLSTLTDTRKVEDISQNAHAAFVVSSEDVPQTVQIEGTLHDLTDTVTVNDSVRHLLAIMMERGPHFAPLTHLDAGSIRLYRLTPTWVRFGDFTDGIGTDRSLIEIPL